MNFLEETNLIYSESPYIEKNKQIKIYKAKENISNALNKSFNLLDISYKIPMIVPPKKYRREDGREILGGFLLNDINFILPLIIKNFELREQSKIKDDNINFDVVNHLSSVGYKINIPVLDFILE